MEIRPYTEDDEERVVVLWRAVMAATYTFLDLHAEFEDRAYFRGVIVVENDLFTATADGEIGILRRSGECCNVSERIRNGR